MVEDENNDWLVEVVSRVTLKEANRINRETRDLLTEIELFKARLQGSETDLEKELAEEEK